MSTPATTKPNKMAQEAIEAKKQQLAERTYVLDKNAWDKAEGQSFGGTADILLVEVGEVVGPFTYTGNTKVTTDLGETISHTASTEDGEQVRLPLGATFGRAVDDARLSHGDKFIIKRMDDVIKKKGKGAGNPMAIYAIKVTSRNQAVA